MVPLQPVVLFVAATFLQQPPAFARRESPAGAASWVAFSADLVITHPSRPRRVGRYVQDEHGCTRRETFYPDGSPMVVITNELTNTMYRLTTNGWLAQSMRPGLGTRPLPRRPVDEKSTPVEGIETYVSRSTVRSPRGDYVREAILAPALNFFEVRTTFPGGETTTAANIRLGPQEHDLFIPPPATTVTPVAGFGGNMTFYAVVITVAFNDEPPLELTTTEEAMQAVTTPQGTRLTLVTNVADWERNLVRVRVLDKATGRPGAVKGELIDEVMVPLGGSAATSKLGENFEVRVTRIGTRTAK